MRQEPNSEIDLLMRRLSRGQRATAPDGNHLDADELNSYAENALPAAARARYTEHLAECSRCRELVVQLSSAAGVVVAVDDLAAAAGQRGVGEGGAGDQHYLTGGGVGVDADGDVDVFPWSARDGGES